MNWLSQSQVIIQGITELPAADYAVQMKAYGTKVVAGVSPGHRGKEIDDIPVFDLVEQAIEQVGKIEISLIFVPPYQVLDAAREAIAAGIKYIIIVTSGVPPLDTISLLKYARAANAVILGPGSQGIVIPEEVWLGKFQPQFYQAGAVGLICCGKYLAYEVAWELNQAKMGQSIIVSLGQEPIVGSDLSHWLSILNADSETKAIVYIGQSLNKTKEITTYCQNHGCDKPIIVYIAGLKTPREKVFLDATTIISNHLSASIPAVNTNQKNMAELTKAGIKVAKRPHEIPALLQQALSKAK